MSKTGRIRLIAIAAIVLATLLAYVPVIGGGGFTWQDDAYLFANPVLVDENAIDLIWTPGNTPQYYPMVFTSFWLEWNLWELNPFGYHLVNVLLHIATALLVWRVFALIGVPGGWLVAALFALHPINVESVAWISERKSVLSAFFYMLAGLSYLHFLRGQDERRPLKDIIGWYGGALVAFVCALLSKTVACSLPAAIILIMLLQRRRLSPANLGPLVPFFVVGLWLALRTAAFEAGQVADAGDELDFGFVERCLIAAKSLLFYAQKLAIPYPLMFVYPRWDIAGASVLAYWPVVVVLAIAVGAAFLFIRGFRGPAIGLAYFAGTLFPALVFFNVYSHRFSFVADHYVYVASLGLIALVAVGWVNVMTEKPRKMVLYALIPLMLCAWLTWNRSAAFQSEETIWRDTLAKNPTSYMPATNLSSLLIRLANLAQANGEIDEMTHLASEAERWGEVAVVARPDWHSAWTDLAEARQLQGKHSDAIDAIHQAIAYAPELPDNYLMLGRLSELTDQPERAIEAYRRTLDLAPNAMMVHHLLGRLLLAASDLDGAAEQFQAILAADPLNPAALGTLAGIRNEQGRYTEARDLFLGAFDASLDAATRPQDVVEIGMRTSLFLAQHPDRPADDVELAIIIAESVVEQTQRALPDTLDVLAAIYAEAGRFEDAVRTGEEALNLARRAGLSGFVDLIESHLEAFREGKTIREADGASDPSAEGTD